MESFWTWGCIAMCDDISSHPAALLSRRHFLTHMCTCKKLIRKPATCLHGLEIGFLQEKLGKPGFSNPLPWLRKHGESRLVTLNACKQTTFYFYGGHREQGETQQMFKSDQTVMQFCCSLTKTGQRRRDLAVLRSLRYFSVDGDLYEYDLVLFSYVINVFKISQLRVDVV